MPAIKILGAQLMVNNGAQTLVPYFKVANMNEFFNTEFGECISKYVEKTNIHIQGQCVYKVVQKFKHPVMKNVSSVCLN